MKQFMFLAIIATATFIAQASFAEESINPYEWMTKSQPTPRVFEIGAGTCVIHDEPGEPWFQMTRTTKVCGRLINRTHHVAYFEICRLEFRKDSTVANWVNQGAYMQVDESQIDFVMREQKALMAKLARESKIRAVLLADSNDDREKAGIRQQSEKSRIRLLEGFESRIQWKGPPLYLDTIAIPIDSIVTESTRQWVLEKDIIHPIRDWMDSTGEFSVEARYFMHDGQKATIQRMDNGMLVSIPLGKLSEKDQRWLRGYMKYLRSPAPNPARDFAIRRARAGRSAARSATRRKNQAKAFSSFSKALAQSSKRAAEAHQRTVDSVYGRSR